MKKKIHLGLILILIGTIGSVLHSCEDEGYDLGNFVVSLATVNPIDIEKGIYYLTMDDGKTLYPGASNVYYTPKNNQRVLVDFTLLSDSLQGYDYIVRINRIQDILTKSIIELNEQNETEIGNDPIKILEYWIGDNYLNIHFGYNTGCEKGHVINLVQNKSEDAKNNNEIVLEFRHNANGDPQLYGAKSYVAFDLRPFRNPIHDTVDFVIRVNDFNNEQKEYRVSYKYKNIERNSIKNKTITNMPEYVSIN